MAADDSMAGGVETLISAAYPILEFDKTSEAVLEPSRIIQRLEGLPDRAVICFFQEVIEQACGAGQATIATHLRSEIGAHPVYDFDPGGGRRVVVFHPGVGAPLAAGLMEEVIALGCRAFVACGGAGALIPGLALGHVIVPTAAVRDEGTSYHYLPPEREVAANPRDVAVAVAVLERHDIPHLVAKTWTTDAPYRETAARIARRSEEGCVTVEMETAAFLAVARHRGVRFAQYLYAGDDVSGEAWDHRSWQSCGSREKLFHLAVEAALEL